MNTLRVGCTICGSPLPQGTSGQTCSYSCRGRLRELRKAREWRTPREYPTEVVDLAVRMYRDGATISEIQDSLPQGFKAQRIVERHVPVRRPTAKRNQRGERNTSWKGDEIGYDAAHERVKAARGSARAHFCVDCGSQAFDWSYVGGCPRELVDPDNGCTYSPDIGRYVSRCRSCHRRYDAAIRALRKSKVGGDA